MFALATHALAVAMAALAAHALAVACQLSRPNRLYGAIGGKIVPEKSFVSPKKHVYGPNFFTKPTPNPQPMPWSWHAWAAMTLPWQHMPWPWQALATHALAVSFLRKNSFTVQILFTKLTPHLFSGPAKGAFC